MTTQIGILGFAHGHVNAYLNEWAATPDSGVKPVCGWDHDEARAAKAREDHGLECAPSAQALLARDDVEAVVIASETGLHANLVEQAAAAGKAIVLQKPMALTLAEADRIVAAVDKAGVRFTMAWQMRVDPQNRKIKELLDTGAIGQVVMVRRRHGLATHTWPWILDSWHIDPKHNRDMWADDAAHPIDLIHWLLGLPESVTAEIASLVNPKIPQDNGIAVFRYADGPLAEVTCSFTAVAAESTTEVLGTGGTILHNYGDGLSTTIPRPKGACGLRWYVAAEDAWTESDIPTPPTHGRRIAGLAEPLARFLHGADPIATAAEGRDSLRMVLACYVSTRQGRRVALDDEAIAAV